MGASTLQAQTALSPMDTCLLEKIRQAEAGDSVGALKAACQTEIPSREQTPAQQSPRSLEAERKTRFSPFVMSPHKQNYVLLASYNRSPNFEIYNIPASDFDRVEMKFQFSFKMPVVENLLGTGADLYAAYTNLSFWQAYNRQISSPFRETVHEPEMFLSIPTDWSLLGWKTPRVQLGAVHQSNGQGGYLSRSWNRFYADFIFEKDNFLVSVKPWYRVPESNDDNPDISHFMGRYELTGLYKHGDQAFSLMTRNLLKGDGLTTFQLDWSFPLYQRWRGYVQYFKGYGESLVDYDARSNRLGFGVQLTDWL